MTSGFSNPIAGGGGALIRPSLHSPDYVAGVSGWTINKDGTAEFNSITVRGKVILGTGTTNIIILDPTQPALFMYDNAGKLIASIAPGSGVDSLGNAYQAGITDYLSGNLNVFSQLVAGNVQLSTGDPAQVIGATILPAFGAGPGNDQPVMTIASPADSGVPTAATSHVEMFGANAGGTALAFIRSRRASGTVDMDWLHQGEIKYSAPGSANYGETWHAIALAANWAVLGAPWGTPAYRKSNGGTVELSGALQWTNGVVAAPVQITQLPVGYRPSSQKHLITCTMPGAAVTPQIETIEARTDGTLWLTNYPAGGPNTPITLENLWFVLGN